jgi:hypothetical protein
VWKRSVNGKVLDFYLAGINNQNFLMRDKQTGTWWQQITGKAIFGPLKGSVLELVSSDELTFGEWKSEIANGKVLAPVPKYVKEYDPKWEPEVAKLPVVISFPGTELKSRDVVVGLALNGNSRAYPWDSLVKESPVLDRVSGTPLLAVVGPDGKSFRIFISRVDGRDAEFYLKGNPQEDGSATQKSGAPATTDSSTVTALANSTVPAASIPTPQKTSQSTVSGWALLDTATASEWDFRGCAISGPAAGKCLDRVPALKDYWFDWRNYHPETTIYKR